MSPTNEIPMSKLTPRQCAMVLRIEAQDDEMERLMSMGVCAGRMVEAAQQGDPMIIKVFGTRLVPCFYVQCLRLEPSFVKG